jgi:hypothetical protein
MSRLSPKSLRQALIKRGFLIDLLGYQSSIFLAGSGRSGTTWTEEIIDANGSYRILFEPFHAHLIPLVQHFNYRQYLRPDNQDPQFLDPAKHILSGKIRHPWIDKFNQTILPRKRLIKDIRANLILRWIKQQFPEIPIILLMRHPCAVASSKLALGWETHLGDFLNQPELMEDFLAPFETLLTTTQEPFEKHILMWCVENYVPLKQFQLGEIYLLFYEQLCQEPEHILPSLFQFIHEPLSSTVMNQIKKPSMLSRKESAIHSGQPILDTWKSQLSEETIQRAIALLHHFGLDQIYTDDLMPKVSAHTCLNLF